MASMDFIEFSNLDELRSYCEENLFNIVEKEGFSIVADIFNQSGIRIGQVSSRSNDYKVSKQNTKFILRLI